MDKGYYVPWPTSRFHQQRQATWSSAVNGSRYLSHPSVCCRKKVIRRGGGLVVAQFCRNTRTFWYSGIQYLACDTCVTTGILCSSSSFITEALFDLYGALNPMSSHALDNFTICIRFSSHPFKVCFSHLQYMLQVLFCIFSDLSQPRIFCLLVQHSTIRKVTWTLQQMSSSLSYSDAPCDFLQPSHLGSILALQSGKKCIQIETLCHKMITIYDWTDFWYPENSAIWLNWFLASRHLHMGGLVLMIFVRCEINKLSAPLVLLHGDLFR